MIDRDLLGDDFWPASLARRVDRICLQFEAAWSRAANADSRPQIEDYLADTPEPERAILLRELLALEWAYRLKQGDGLRLAEYSHRFPEHRALLRELWNETVPAERQAECSEAAESLASRMDAPAGRGHTPATSGGSPLVADASNDTEKVHIPLADDASNASDGSLRISLTVTAGPHKGKMFTFLGHDTFVVGRSKRAHFQLPRKDRYFSRIHFLVEVNPPHCRLMDMASRNGTAVNGQRVSTVDLKDGDQIRAGRTLFRVSVERIPVPPAAPRVKEPAPKPPAQLPEPRQAPQVVSAPRPEPSPKPAPPSEQIRQQASPAGKSCLACTEPIVSAGPLPPQQRDDLKTPLFCEACLERIRNSPQPIPGYQILRELGRGGMGVVHMALRVADGTIVALKTIAPAAANTRTKVEKFFREAEILKQLHHPHIVTLRDMGEAEGLLYFAMDYVQGIDAARLLKQRGAPLPIERAVGLVCQLLEALEYAHAKKFVHRDIKPGNMLLAKDGEREVVRLADFGLARVYQASQLSGLTITGDIGGTMAFLPPEQITDFRGAKPAADQYSAGATLYNLLTNRYIFDFPTNHNERLLMIMLDDPVPVQARRPDVPKDLAGIIHRTLAKRAQDRFPNVNRLRRALAPFCQ